MANIFTNFVARVSVSAIVGAAVGAVVVTYARNPSVEALSTDSAAIVERLAAMETAASENQAAILAKLDETAASLAALQDSVAQSAVTAEAQAETAAATQARIAEAVAAIEELRATVASHEAPTEPTQAAAATVDLTPVLDALARIEAGMTQQ